MKLSLNWLNSYFKVTPNWSIVWDKLTACGIEIEGIETVAPAFSDIVVASVIECKPHPDADKLKVCTVDAGTGDLLQLICGASNVTIGVKVPCAKVGAVLPGGMQIGERKMRGLTSFGMLCSGSEIGVPDGVDGLLLLPSDAPIGTSIREYLDLDDQIIEFKITPNRGDCLSVRGLVREIVAITAITGQSEMVQITATSTPFVSSSSNDSMVVDISDKEGCPNYAVLVIKGINNQVKLPNIVKKRLNRS